MARSRTPRRRTGTDASARAAIATGRSLARAAIRQRDAALRRRAANLRRAPVHTEVVAVPAARAAALGGPKTLGVLVAEGDSWFDYPGRDVLSAIEEQGYDVVSVAHAGHTVESMAYSERQLADFIAEIDKLIANSTMPRAILLSGGGNDVAGDEFAMLLDHRLSSTAGLNAAIVHAVIHQRIRDAYITILTQVTEACRRRAGREIPIILHGYDWPVPDGRGFLGGALFLPGPWLDPGFRLKGFDRKDAVQFDRMKGMTKALIVEFNRMLRGVTEMKEFAGHVRCLDLQGTLQNGDYRKWWANELHPTDRGFTAIAMRYAALLAKL
jgi:hypothetical protein